MSQREGKKQQILDWCRFARAHGRRRLEVWPSVAGSAQGTGELAAVAPGAEGVSRAAAVETIATRLTSDCRGGDAPVCGGRRG
jgi:hypothetical protein